MTINMDVITRGISRGKILTQKHSPEILLGLGIFGVVASAVMASKATLKAEEVKKNNAKKVNLVQLARVNNGLDEYSEEDYQKDVIITQVQNALEWVKLYGPSAAVMGASIFALVGSHGIMKERTASIAAAYALLQEGFTSYRNRVVNELGVDEDRKFRFGISEIEETETVVNEETGRRNKKKVVKKVVDPNAHSDYARFFDEYSVYWRREPQMNMTFLKAQQAYANDMLRARGHVFLNEVYDSLGIPRSREGTVTGWILNGDGDGFIDFGLYELTSADFVNGYEASILLDFNVDGLIWELI